MLHPDVLDWACGIEIDRDLHDTMQQWLRAAGVHWPWLQHCTELLEGNMINGDFTRDSSVSKVLQSADVVFVNNYLFDHPTGQKHGVSLNQKLKAMLCATLTPEATIVTTSSLSDNRRPTKRPREDSSTSQLVVTHRSFPLKPSDVSWHGNLSAHISSVCTL